MSAHRLHLAKDLALPLDAVSRTFGILAVRGAGKSNTAAVMAEEMFAAGLPFVVIDPVGSWYGLRSSADGTAPGLPIPIFGGKHGDVPLERGAGELLADLIVEKRLTCVLDLSRAESESAKKQFLLAFAQRLYLKNENPLHLFLEEADDYIPQKPMRDEAQLLRAWENIVRRGRARGLGMTIITQRSAAVAKMVLTQVETLFAMRTTGPQDIAAIEAWVKYHQVGKDVLSTLAGLENGEAWVWSPHYLKTMSRHQIRRRKTFDSGATPSNVKAKDTRPPATLADINLDAIQSQMAATIEKAKADDPRELKKQIAELKKELHSQKSEVISPKSVNKPVLTDADRALLEKVGRSLDSIASDIGARSGAFLAGLEERLNQVVENAFTKCHVAGEELHERRRKEFATLLELKGFQKILGKLATVESGRNYSETIPASRKSVNPQAFGRAFEAAARVDRPAHHKAAVVAESNGSLSRAAERRVLGALVQYPDGRSMRQVALLAGYAMNGGGFRNAVSKLRSLGYIEGKSDRLKATSAGAEALGPVDPLPTGGALASYWLQQLDRKAEREILTVLLNAYPAALTADQIAERTDSRYEPNGGGFRNALGKLRTLELIEGRGELRASEELCS